MAAACIVFADIVGFSTKPTSLQREIVDSFNNELRTFIGRFFDPFSGESEIIALPTGDGACLSFMLDNDNRKWDVSSVFEIIIRLHKWAYDISKPENIVQLRIGVHMGVVDVVLDLNNKKNVVGDTINYTARVMSAAKPCQTLISDTVYNQYIGISIQRFRLLINTREIFLIFKKPVKIFAKHERELTVHEMVLDPPVRFMYNSDSDTETSLHFDGKNATAIKKDIEPEIVPVIGGSFMMGSKDGNRSEKPVHKVDISSFEMSIHPITQKQWKAVMGSNPSKNKDKDNCPVEWLTFKEVQEYLKKLNDLTGKNYRLPTEAEWEYAARGGALSKGYKYAGSNNLSTVAWNYENSGSATHPVGAKLPNELGLFDMTGNVYEWCNDWYDENYYAISPSSNPLGPQSGENRVIRGGAWINYPARYQVTDRDFNFPNDRRTYLGFRVVLSN